MNKIGPHSQVQQVPVSEAKVQEALNRVVSLFNVQVLNSPQETLNSCLNSIVTDLKDRDITRIRNDTDAVDILLQKGFGKSLEHWLRLANIAQIFDVPFGLDYWDNLYVCMTAFIKALEEKQSLLISTNKEAIGKWVMEVSEASLENWECLIDIAQVFNVPLEPNYALLSDTCMMACEKAYDEGHWELMTHFNKENGYNSLSLLRDLKGKTLLMRLMGTKYLKHLINHNIATSETDAFGNNALHIAAQEGAVAAISILRTKCDLKGKNNRGETPLHVAILYGQDKVLEAFLQKGINFNLPYFDKTLNSNMSPFLFSVMRGEIACSNLLIKELVKEKEENPFLDRNLDKVGNFLHVAVYFKQFKMLDHLLRCSELVHYLKEYKKSMKDYLEGKNSDGMTPLNLAASLGDHQVIEILFRHHASISTIDSNGNTPLHNAAFARKFEAVRVLTALGADLLFPNGDGLSAHAALKVEKIEKGDKSVATQNIITFLTNLIEAKKEEIIELALQLPQNCVFKGGGPKGYAYLGVLIALEQFRVLGGLKRVAGTSSGAINASLIAAGIDSLYFEKLMETTDMVKILLDPPENPESLISALENRQNASMVKTIWRVLASAKKPIDLLFSPCSTIESLVGICRGERFREWIEEQICFLTGTPYCTFGELSELVRTKGGKYKHLQVFTVRIGKNQQTVCLSSEDPNFENFIISDAVRASMSIPFVFVPHILHIKEGKDRVAYKEFGSFVDGGVNYNLPVEAYDRLKFLPDGESAQFKDKNPDYPCFNNHTISFDLCQILPPAKNENTATIIDLFKGLFGVYTEGEALRRQMNSFNETRIVEIDVGNIGLLDFDIDQKQKKVLIDSGYNATMRHFRDKYPSTPSQDISILTNTIKGKISLPKAISDQEFVGREKELQELHSKGIGSNWHPTSDTKTIEISGLAGMGKTELALAFARRNLEQFSIVKLIKCHNYESYIRGYRELAKLLGILRKNKTEDQLIANVNSALEKQTYMDEGKAKPWLIIFDGVQDRQLPLPKRGGTVIWTCRKMSNNANDYIPLRPLQALQLKEQLQSLQPKETEKKSLLMKYFRLVDSLNGSPLLLTMAKNFIEYANVTEDIFLIELNHLNDTIENNVIKMMLDCLLVKAPRSFQFLGQLAYLSPFTLDRAIEDCAKESSRENLLHALEILGIVKWEDQDTFSCSLEFLNYLLRSSPSFNATLQLLARFAQKLDLSLKEDWANGSLLLEQVEYLKNQPQWNSIECAQEKVICLSKASRLIACVQGNVQKAVEFLSEAMKIGGGKDYVEIEVELGRAYSLLIKHEMALLHYQKAAENLPQSQLFKGEFWILNGDSELALKHFENALQSYQRAFSFNSSNSIHKATCLSRIGDLKIRKGEPIENVITQYQEALKEWKEGCGKNDIRLVQCHVKIGKAQIADKKFPQSKASFEEALSILKNILKDLNEIDRSQYHHELSKINYYFAISQESCKEYGKAISAFDEVLIIEKDSSRLRARCLAEKGFCLKELKEISGSLKLYNDAIQILLDIEPFEGKNKAELNRVLEGFLASLECAEANVKENMKTKLLEPLKKKLGENHSAVRALKGGDACLIS